MVIIGITGNIGCGKTTVSKMFSDLGARTLDIDKISHRCLKKNRSLVNKKFKLNYNRFDESGRKKLAKIVFNDSFSLKKLCSILHPCMIGSVKRILEDIREKKCKSVVVIDCALLFEMKIDMLADYILVVNASLPARISRLKNRGFCKNEIKNRNKCQLSQKEKINKADFYINNEGSLNITRKQVIDIWKNINI